MDEKGKKVSTETVDQVWGKVLSAMGEETFRAIQAGSIPVYDGSRWWIFRNSLTIYPGAENCIDPAKVDKLRQNVNSLFDHYPETVKQLEKLGARTKQLLKKRIETLEDINTWALSLFNSGPIQNLSEPQHVHDTKQLAYDDFIIEVKSGRQGPVYVVPVGPRGSGIKETFDFSVLGSKKRYGARHEFSQLAFDEQVEKKPTRSTEGKRPRGRPRIDGLTPGSPEAKQADDEKQREREAKRAARQKNKDHKGSEASITELHPPAPRRRLARKADRQEATS
jgi:hypothetical protein